MSVFSICLSYCLSHYRPDSALDLSKIPFCGIGVNIVQFMKFNQCIINTECLKKFFYMRRRLLGICINKYSKSYHTELLSERWKVPAFYKALISLEIQRTMSREEVSLHVLKKIFFFIVNYLYSLSFSWTDVFASKVNTPSYIIDYILLLKILIQL